MKRSFILCLLACCSFGSLFSQTFWANGVGGNNADEALDVTKDNSGNIISVGYFTNTASFSTSTTLTSSSQGIPDVFIQKSDAAGNLLWVVKAGGSGSDRATAVKTDGSGNIYITGFYYGTATFGSFGLSSVNGSQDIFIARLNSNGVFQWAVSAGGSMGDYVYGLALDQNNNVFITGQFEGTSTFGSQSLTSQTNPQTGLPSFDIFTAKYNSSGAFQWVKQGRAEYNDRGMDLVCDNNGNVYVTGQFSDTITFQNIYNNNVMNAIFIIKYNSSGQEVWFRKAAGAFGIGYSIALYNNQDLYVCGDYKGTLTFFGSPNNFLNDVYTNRIFLAKYTTSGNFVWAQSDASDNPLSARAIALSSTGDVYIAGEFGCVMNEYSNLYGPAIFNSIGYTDIFVCKYTSAGTRSWERQIGGPAIDKLHGVVEGISGNPILAGSYEHFLNFPSGAAGFTAYPPTWNSGFWQQGMCNDPYYGRVTQLQGLGFSDAFVSDGIDLSRQPYDYYIRPTINCVRPQLDICIEAPQANFANCPDTIRFCGPSWITCNTHQPGYGISPYQHYDWAGPGTAPIDSGSSLNVTTSGYYSVKTNTWDGCFLNEDSVYVHVGNMQSPTITDDHGVNYQSPPYAQTIQVCAPDTIVLTGGNIGAYSYSWDLSVPGIIASHDSVLVVNASGAYHFTLTGPDGCTTLNSVGVNLQIPGSVLPKSNMPDTFTICEGEAFQYILYDSITNPGGIIPYGNCFANVMEYWSSIPNMSGTGFNSNCYLSTFFSPSQTGTYIIKDSLKIQNLCGFETHVFIDTIYVIVNPNPIANIHVTGPQFMCIDDSIPIVVSCSTPFVWFDGSTNDTLYVSQPGSYSAGTSIVDSITGCSAVASDGIFILPKPDPVIDAVPITALICPNDSVQLHVNVLNAVNYEWHGPMGIIPINSQNIYVNIQGFYHCVVTDADGCVLTSNTTEVRQYSTPYLVGQPTTILCPGQTTNILVVTDVSSIIQWQAPLSGSLMTQLITIGGTYYCNVTACGITTNCSIQVIQSSPVAIATAGGPTYFCPGDSVILHGNSGMAGYSWNPTSYNGQYYTVYNPGTYSLTVTDGYGCSATSNAITVTWNTSVPPPTAVGDTVCAGDTAMLIASIASGPLEWYASFPSSSQLSANDTFLVAPLDNSTIYYVTTQNSAGCHSVWVPVNAVVYETSLLPGITNDTLACFGDSIQLSTNTINGASYQWMGPNNFSSTLQNPIVAVANSVSAGTYSLTISGYGCTSPMATIEMDVMQPQAVFATGDSVLCEGDNAQVQVHTQHQPVTIYYLDTAGVSQALADSSYTTGSLAPGSYNYIFYESYYGCAGPAVTHTVTVKPRPWLNAAFSNLPACTGDSVHLFTTDIPNAVYSWSGPNNFSGSGSEIAFANADSTLNGNYYVSAVLNGCAGDTALVHVNVFPGTSVNLGNDTTVCAEDGYIIDAGPGYAHYYWNNGAITQNVPIDSTHIYAVVVANSYGCTAYDSVFISVITCNPVMVNIFTPNGDGVNDVFHIAGEQFRDVECTIFDRWGLKINAWKGKEGFWDGTNQRKEIMPAGTYYYVGTLTDYRGFAYELNGFIQLSR